MLAIVLDLEQMPPSRARPHRQHEQAAAPRLKAAARRLAARAPRAPRAPAARRQLARARRPRVHERAHLTAQHHRPHLLAAHEAHLGRRVRRLHVHAQLEGTAAHVHRTRLRTAV